MMYLRSRTPIYPDGKLKILGKLAEADFSITHKPMLSTKYLVQMGYRLKAKPKTYTLGPLDWSDYVTLMTSRDQIKSGGQKLHILRSIK